MFSLMDFENIIPLDYDTKKISSESKRFNEFILQFKDRKVTVTTSFSAIRWGIESLPPTMQIIQSIELSED